MLDTVIIGGGLAGLTAANVLKKKKMNFKLIESDDRVGGKILSADNKDQSSFYELGPQFVNENMTEMLQLIKAAGMDLKETAILENGLAIDDNKNIQVDLESHRLQDLFDIKSLKKSDKSLFELYDNTIKDPALKRVISSALTELFNIHPRKLSGRAALKRAYKSMSFTQSDLAYQASGKLNNVVEFLQKDIQSNIVINDTIVEIRSIKGGYKLRSSNGNEYFTKAVILAIPPTVASQIVFSKEIESHFKKALDSYIEGAIIKITWQFDRPFWHQTNIEGKNVKVKEITFTQREGISIVDSSRDDDFRLTMFIGADLAKQLATKDASYRLSYAFDRLYDVFGDQLIDYKDVAEKSWVGGAGGYGATIRINGLPEAGTILSTPYKNLVFASSEVSNFTNFMEGAVRAGKHAATTVHRKGIVGWLGNVYYWLKRRFN